ncbi:MAG: hypothetical protein ACE5KZ_01215 [Candidatus Scalinduaceae bacterium]
MKIETFVIPKKDKEIFIKPIYKDIPGLIELNKERFQSYNFNINGIPFSKFRKQARTEILKKAREYSEKLWFTCSKLKIISKKDLPSIHNSYTPDKTIIQTGHPPILAHPGIMVKNKLVNSISKSVNGIGINMVVDNDGCHDNYLNIPKINGLSSSMEKIEFVSRLYNLAFEEVRYTDATQLTAFKKNVLRIISNPDMKKTFKDFIDMVIALSKETKSLGDLFTYSIHSYLQRFSISNLEIPVSLISETESFLNFFLHIVGDIRNFVRIYNAKLGEYRKLKKISSKANPLPDLMVKEDMIELPFWIWKKNEPRERLFASVTSDKHVSLVSENIVVADLDFYGKVNSSENLRKIKILINAGMKIRPKAIITTMYSRMFFSDLFIHGVGGAKYDLVTDEIIRAFFGVEPPGHATITATLHLPYKPYNASGKDIRVLKQDINDMNYNPERYAPRETMEDVGMRSMISEKKDLIARETHDSKERRWIFNRLKQLNALMKEKIKPLIDEKETEIEQIEKKLMYNSIVTNREYLFCIYPESMLRELFKLEPFNSPK